MLGPVNPVDHAFIRAASNTSGLSDAGVLSRAARGHHGGHSAVRSDSAHADGSAASPRPDQVGRLNLGYSDLGVDGVVVVVGPLTLAPHDTAPRALGFHTSETPRRAGP